MDAIDRRAPNLGLNARALAAPPPDKERPVDLACAVGVEGGRPFIVGEDRDGPPNAMVSGLPVNCRALGGKLFSGNEVGSSILDAAHALACSSERAFADRVSGRAIQERAKLGRIPESPILVQVQEGGEAVARFAPCVTIDEAVRGHNALRRLAHEMQLRSLVPLAAATVLPPNQAVSIVSTTEKLGPGRSLMLVERLSSQFMSANKVEPKLLERVPAKTRVQAALLDFLTFQMDRIPQNLMVDGSGEIRLIDHDFSLGHVHPNGGYPSIFFPGETLGFAAEDQRSVSDLPRAAREVVEALSGASISSVQARYGLSETESAILVHRARRVSALGLSGAIAEAARVPFELLKDGTLVREASHGEVYLIRGATKWHVPNPETFKRMRLDWDRVQLVGDGLLTGIADRVTR